jgi:tetratricopeptide (TPR) repeat protein
VKLAVHISAYGRVLLFLLFFVPRPGRADSQTANPGEAASLAATPAPALSPAQTKLSKSFFLRGQAYFRQGKYQAAWLEFSSAYELSRLPDLAFNLAQCEVRMNRPKDAIAHYREFLSAKPDDGESASIRQEVARLERELNGGVDPALATAAPRPRRIPIASVVLGGSAVLLTIFGGIAVGVASSNFNSLSVSCKPNCSPNQVQGVRATLDAGDAMFGLAAASAVAFAIVLPFELGVFRKTKQNPPKVALGFGLDSSGIAERRF